MKKIRVCLAGVTGWTGRAVAAALLKSSEFELVGAVARKASGQDVGSALGGPKAGLRIVSTVEEALARKPQVLVDYTHPSSVRGHVDSALRAGSHVVVGTSGLTAADYKSIHREALRARRGVVAAGNFSVTAALAKRFALLAAEHLPSWEIVEYAHAQKPDVPSGTVRELAERLAEVRRNAVERPVESLIGPREARGASVAGTPVHSIRLPSYVIAFETIFGLPDERLSIRHDAGSGAEPYVAGTLLAGRLAPTVRGLLRGLDTLLFDGAKRA